MSYVAHAYTPRETGSYGGRDHLVTEVPIHSGRLVRHPGDALCKPARRFWGLHRTGEGSPVTCKRCLEIAQRPDVAVALGQERQDG